MNTKLKALLLLTCCMLMSLKCDVDGHEFMYGVVLEVLLNKLDFVLGITVRMGWFVPVELLMGSTRRKRLHKDQVAEPDLRTGL